MTEASSTEDPFVALVEEDPVTRTYIRAFAARVEALRGFALGLYAEALVAQTLGGSLSPGGTDDADVSWTAVDPAITIQVRSCHLVAGKSRMLGSLTISPPTRRECGRREIQPRQQLGEIWVFAVHVGDDHRFGWKFLARRADELDALFRHRKKIAFERLAHFDQWCESADLADAIVATRNRRP